MNKATDKTQAAVAGTAAPSTRPAKTDPPQTDPSPTGTTDATTPPADVARDEQTPGDPKARTSDCVVNDGRGMHVGRAVNGKVCSYHAMQYHADGTPR